MQPREFWCCFFPCSAFEDEGTETSSLGSGLLLLALDYLACLQRIRCLFLRSPVFAGVVESHWPTYCLQQEGHFQHRAEHIFFGMLSDTCSGFEVQVSRPLFVGLLRWMNLCAHAGTAMADWLRSTTVLLCAVSFRDKTCTRHSKSCDWAFAPFALSRRSWKACKT